MKTFKILLLAHTFVFLILWRGRNISLAGANDSSIITAVRGPEATSYVELYRNWFTLEWPIKVNTLWTTCITDSHWTWIVPFHVREGSFYGAFGRCSWTTVKIVVLNFSSCPYHFTCIFGDAYVGRTKRPLSRRMFERIPQWLIEMIQEDFPDSQWNRNLGSSFVRQIMKSKHKEERTPFFESLSLSFNSKQLAFSEALPIELRYPLLCVQKMLTQSTHQPWSWIQFRDCSFPNFNVSSKTAAFLRTSYG